MITINQIKKAFFSLYKGIVNERFSKQNWFSYRTEQKLLPCIRFFLLGYFENTFEPEASAFNPYSNTGKGRFDFLIGDVAVEIAVRTPYCSSKKIEKCYNEDEIAKLSKYSGPSALVLFDFSDDGLTDAALNEYTLLSLGKGVKRNSYSLLYYFKDNEVTPTVVRKNIKNR